MEPCDQCRHPKPEKGRAFDGRRAYRCPQCDHSWTEGMQGRKPRYSPQRQGYQFADTGAERKPRYDKVYYDGLAWLNSL